VGAYTPTIKGPNSPSAGRVYADAFIVPHSSPISTPP